MPGVFPTRLWLAAGPVRLVLVPASSWIGTKVAHDTTGVYEYLPASIRNFPDQERLKQMLLDAGFRQVTYRNLTGGIVAIHVAIK